MVKLNEVQGFSWVSAGGNKDGFGKASIAGECFWLETCEKGGNNLWTGVVNNHLIYTETHGLQLGDKVSFIVNN